MTKIVSGEVQGDERKRTTDEVSKTIRRRQNWGPFTTPGKVQGQPAYCLGGVRHAGGVNLNRALARNVGPVVLMLREKPKWNDSARVKVPMQGTGTDQLVVVWKFL